MSFIGLVLLALALAADSFAVSLAKGARIRHPRIGQALVVGAVFGGIQMLMPLLGWQVGLELQPLVREIDHWIAFAILAAIGTKMMVDAFREPDGIYQRNAFTIAALILAAIATSIDALVVGFGFGFLNISVLVALATIGMVTFTASFAGVYLARFFGQHLGHHMGRYVEFAGGAILIAIGVKILFEHLSR
ncbi:MAG: manganese efflux pump [Rhodospirillaceae bacterium]|jgi:manganese efflux pump family protein|nr:manganese efflux pump [Rhodospirillaceae bacterium]